MGFAIVHVYGLTETYGPYSVSQRQRAWDAARPEERAPLRARQGVGMQAERMRVVERVVDEDERRARRRADHGRDRHARQQRDEGLLQTTRRHREGLRGRLVPLRRPRAWHPDGYVELRDRAKDVVVSGGENISTIEVEQALVAHHAVLEAAVIGVPGREVGRAAQGVRGAARPGRASPRRS